ncbi:hypothetical protein PLESTM_000323700 [Pleodorina starrii]|nr:hypothetical protein PLESTM_000323700 [Pleodorina starrii]
MRQAVLVGGIGAAVSGLTAYQGIHMVSRRSEEQQLHRLVLLKLAAAALMLLAAGIAAVAGRNFVRRVHMIRTGVGSDSPQWDSLWLPRLFTGIMASVMASVMVAALVRVCGGG